MKNPSSQKGRLPPYCSGSVLQNCTHIYNKCTICNTGALVLLKQNSG